MSNKCTSQNMFLRGRTFPFTTTTHVPASAKIIFFFFYKNNVHKQEERKKKSRSVQSLHIALLLYSSSPKEASWSVFPYRISLHNIFTRESNQLKVTSTTRGKLKYIYLRANL
uniref:Uncharacterized protein n=1 Tax=Trypanosoma congolense (strain IL3000) TaxID=1068625 RepID=G0UR33_TRYCI|nr:hypothetical protein, unlikely [Trypanosoma congolense IL3000]